MPIPYSSKKIYGNYQVLSPDNILMFRCDEKKANWYIDRNLATYCSPLVLKLNFNPKGLGNHNRPFGLEEMKNICVNCGSEDMLTKHHIVPICYRKYFHLNLKSHNFHDVLSLCMSCHETYERKADELKSYISRKYEIPIHGLYSNNVDKKLIKNCNTLKGDISKIPQDRIDQIRKEIKESLGREFTDEDIIEISRYKSILLEKTHGELVVEKLIDIQPFIEMWRKHFIENNDCKFLPNNWNIKNVFHMNDTLAKD